SVFDGTQPAFTQVPPSGNPAWTNAVFAPRSLALMAAPNPPAPPPMTMRSYCGTMICLSALLLRGLHRFGFESRGLRNRRRDCRRARLGRIVGHFSFGLCVVHLDRLDAGHRLRG